MDCCKPHKVFGYLSDTAPSLFEFYDSLTDQVHSSDRRTFLFRGIALNRGELSDPYFVEMLLKDFLFQYTRDDGIEGCDCQNIILQEMVEDE
jgi:hypothetical protein